MEITCPACAATYEVSPAAVSAGRVVRCARCGRTWVPVPAPVPVVSADRADESHPPVGQDAVPAGPGRPDAWPPDSTVSGPAWPGGIAAPTPSPSRSETPTRQAAPVKLAVGWAASILLLIGLAVVLVHERQAIVAAWPPAARLYAWLGLARRP